MCVHINGSRISATPTPLTPAHPCESKSPLDRKIGLRKASREIPRLGTAAAGGVATERSARARLDEMAAWWGRKPDSSEEKLDTSQRDAAVSAACVQLRGASNDGFAGSSAVLSVPFQSQGVPMALRIEVPATFPSQAPVMMVEGAKVMHPWVDSRGCVSGNPKVLNWFPHYDLVQVVVETLEYFSSSPPRVLTSSVSAGGSDSNSVQSDPAGRTTPTGELGARGSSEEGTVFHTPLPAVPAAFPQLDDMDVGQMRRLLADDVAMEVMVEGMSVVSDYRKMLSETRSANLELAEKLLAREKALLDERDNCLVLQSELRAPVEAFKAAAADVTVDAEGVMADLQNQVDEADMEKEDEGAALADGKDVREWCEAFMEKATRYHRLAALKERLSRSIAAT